MNRRSFVAAVSAAIALSTPLVGRAGGLLRRGRQRHVCNESNDSLNVAYLRGPDILPGDDQEMIQRKTARRAVGETVYPLLMRAQSTFGFNIRHLPYFPEPCEVDVFVAATGAGPNEIRMNDVGKSDELFALRRFVEAGGIAYMGLGRSNQFNSGIRIAQSFGLSIPVESISGTRFGDVIDVSNPIAGKTLPTPQFEVHDYREFRILGPHERPNPVNGVYVSLIGSIATPTGIGWGLVECRVGAGRAYLFCDEVPLFVTGVESKMADYHTAMLLNVIASIANA